MLLLHRNRNRNHNRTMRHGRAKASRRTLQFYRLNAPHLRAPYRLLLDGTFLVSSVRNKVPLRERFAKTLQNEEFVCYVARSTLDELEKLSRSTSRAKEAGGDGAGGDEHDGDNANVFARARRYGLDECEIIEGDRIPQQSKTSDTGEGNTNRRRDSNNANNKQIRKAMKGFSDASRDIFNLATSGGNNRLAYFVATQDDALADALRCRPYVPLFRLGRAVLLLESPSSASRSYTGNVEQTKLKSAGGHMTAEERKIVDEVKRRERRKRKAESEEERKRLEKKGRDEVGGGFTVRRKKKAKGPNPLSCKKKR